MNNSFTILNNINPSVNYLITKSRKSVSFLLFAFFAYISGYGQLSGNLNGIDTLKLADSPFLVTGNISFTAGTHVVEAGVELQFEPNTGLEIGQANMLFQGTAADPILLTSTANNAGLWYGVYFNTNSDNGVSSTLDFVTIENAGAGSWNANLYCANTNQPQANYCTFANAAGNGVRLNMADVSFVSTVFSNNEENGCYLQNSNPSFSGSDLLSNDMAGVYFADFNSNPIFVNCDFMNNYLGIQYFSPNHSFQEISGITTYTNTVPGIAMSGGNITDDQTWKFNPLGYAILGDVKVVKHNSKVRLTIKPGNTVYIDTTAQLQVGQYVSYAKHYGGELYAEGKADSLITFTSVNGQQGGWDGIFFHYNSDTFDSHSSLSYCTIENGKDFNIKSDGSAEPRIDQCTINNSNGYDIYAFAPNDVQHITNTNSTVYVGAGTQTIDKKWYYFGGDYVIVGEVIVAKHNDTARLTIQPGNTINVDTTFGIQVGQYVSYNQQHGGELYAEGKADSLITFTSRNGLVGGWDGIYFHYNSAAFGLSSSLSYCIIEKGDEYNVKSAGSPQPRIDMCTINNSNGYDIYAFAPNDVQHITNTNSTVYVGAGTQTIDKKWYYFGGDYVIVGEVIVAKHNDTARLTIQPGNTIKVDTTFGIQVGQYVYYNQTHGGELYADGKSDSLITFTSRNGLVGGWDGIYFHDYSDAFGCQSSLSFCTIEKGDAYNIKSSGSSQPRIDMCTINNTNGYDIFAVAPNDVQHITNTNSTVFVGAGTQTIDKKWYYFGGDYVIVGEVIVAKHNDTARLTIQPGNSIKVDTTFGIQVGQYVYYNQVHGGELYADGKPDSLITFTSRNGLVGGWDGIYFHNYSDEFDCQSSISYCTIEKGDSYNVYCENTIEPRIDNCTINNTMGYDIYALNPNSVPHVTNTVSTIYIGEGIQSIDKTWYNFGGEYILIGNVFVAKKNSFSTLNIEPGITIKGDSAIKIQIGHYIHYLQNYGGEIIAEGTVDDPITFMSSNCITDPWNGIYFHENADNFGGNSSLKHCIIDGSKTNNLRCESTSILNLENVTFINSRESGVRLNNSSPYLKLCQFINNDSIGIILTGSSNPVIGDTLGNGCDIYGNGDFGIYNATSNDILARNNFWNSTDILDIGNRIYDINDNGAYGLVHFEPVATTSYLNNHPPNEFNLLSIEDYGVTSDQTPDFTWATPTDPDSDAISYYFCYTDDSTWATNIVVSEEVSSPSYTIPEVLTGGKWYWWKVKATDGHLTKFSNQLWRFAVSLPPSIPTPMAPANGAHTRDADFLTWSLSTDPDAGDYVSHYHLQIDDNPDFSSPVIDTLGIMVDGGATEVSIQISDLNDYLALENKNYYWRVGAIDGFGIESDFSGGSNYFLYLLEFTFDVMLEGPFNGTDMNTTLNTNNLIPLSQPYNTSPWNYTVSESVASIPPNVADWILLELRNTTGDASTATPDKNIYRKAAFVLNDGSLVDLDGASPFEFPVSFDDNVFLVVYHRNHLSIISGDPLSIDAASYDYDFTTGSGKVYGGTAGYKELSPGTWGLASGDANADGFINTDDKSVEWSEQAGQLGYIYADFNLDGQAENLDKNDKWLINDGMDSQVPN